MTRIEEESSSNAYFCCMLLFIIGYVEKNMNNYIMEIQNYDLSNDNLFYETLKLNNHGN